MALNYRAKTAQCLPEGRRLLLVAPTMGHEDSAPVSVHYVGVIGVNVWCIDDALALPTFIRATPSVNNHDRRKGCGHDHRGHAEMIIEQRRYTAVPGKTGDFFALQESRGYDMVQDILRRLIGYFHTVDDGPEQIVHLWRYDDAAEWTALLHGLYQLPELKSYFTTVRRILVRQENCFLAPYPVPALSPLWCRRDWLPASGPVFHYSPDLTVHETTLAFAPASLPIFLDVLLREVSDDAGVAQGLIGTFTTLIGRQHVVTLYRCCGGSEFPTNLPNWSDWSAIDGALSELTPERSERVYKPAPFPTLSPLFAFT
jgi:hypothetical protein